MKPEDIKERFSQELEVGESLLWTGQPERSVVFHQQDWLAVPFSLMWGGFALFWESGASGIDQEGHKNWFFVLWGVPFVLVGQYLIWGRFIHAAWIKSRTFYALTSRRILVLDTALKRRLLERDLLSMESLHVEEGVRGIGTIDFQPSVTASPWMSRNSISWSTNLSQPSFVDILRAREVYLMVKEARQKARASNGYASMLPIK